jgi:hypothetical protein
MMVLVGVEEAVNESHRSVKLFQALGSWQASTFRTSKGEKWSKVVSTRDRVRRWPWWMDG